MADEDSVNDDLGDEEGAAAAPAKKGGIGGLLPTLLKYIALALGAIILIVTVVIITMNIKEIAEELEWYTSLNEIQTRTSDPTPASVVVNIFLGYKKEDKVTSTEITAQRIPIRDFLRNYFAAKTAEELTPRNEGNIKIEIRNEINDTILNRGKIKAVSFDKLNVVAQ